MLVLWVLLILTGIRDTFLLQKALNTYRKIASSNMSRLEAHVGFFRLLMKWIFGPYVP